MAKKRLLNYQRVLNHRHNAIDPWDLLANAIVEVAADDYRYFMTKKVTQGLSMSEMELRFLDSNILEVKNFFESDWGFLCSHGLAMVIWSKLQAEFTEQLARFELCYPFAVKHRAKQERKRKAAQRRWEKNKARKKAATQGQKIWNIKARKVMVEDEN